MAGARKTRPKRAVKRNPSRPPNVGSNRVRLPDRKRGSEPLTRATNPKQDSITRALSRFKEAIQRQDQRQKRAAKRGGKLRGFGVLNFGPSDMFGFAAKSPSTKIKRRRRARK